MRTYVRAKGREYEAEDEREKERVEEKRGENPIVRRETMERNNETTLSRWLLPPPECLWQIREESSSPQVAGVAFALPANHRAPYKAIINRRPPFRRRPLAPLDFAG